MKENTGNESRLCRSKTCHTQKAAVIQLMPSSSCLTIRKDYPSEQVNEDLKTLVEALSPVLLREGRNGGNS